MAASDGPVWWSDAREVVIVGLMAAAFLSALSGVLHAVTARADSVGDRILIFGQQMNPTTASLMILAAIVLVSGRPRTVRVGVRVLLFRGGVLLSVAAAFSLLATAVKPGPSLVNRLVGITRASAPALVLFVVATWLARSVVVDPARSADD